MTDDPTPPEPEDWRTFPCPVDDCDHEGHGETALVYHLDREHPDMWEDAGPLAEFVIPNARTEDGDEHVSRCASLRCPCFLDGRGSEIEGAGPPSQGSADEALSSSPGPSPSGGG